MKPRKKKLAFQKETIKRLGTDELRGVGGGMPPYDSTDECATQGCTDSCSGVESCADFGTCEECVPGIGNKPGGG